MAPQARTGVLSAAAGLTRAAAWGPAWRGAFSSALAREVEERRFFLWKKCLNAGLERKSQHDHWFI
jgi:hypothetical protein